MYLEIVSVLLAAVFLHYWWNVRQFRKRHIPHSWPIPFAGNNARILLGQTTLPYQNLDLYNRFKGHRFYGVFDFTVRTIMIKDPEIIKNITVKDFEHFTDHTTLIPDDIEPVLSRNLVGLKGHEWRTARNTLSPAFTSSKMKFMFQLMSECGKQLTAHINKLQQQERDLLILDMKEMHTRFTNDVIATCAFGISCDSLEEKNNKVYKMGIKAANMGGTTLLRLLAASRAPTLMKLLGMEVFAKDATDFFKQLIHDTLRYRKEKNIFRPDMIQLLMEARKVQKNLTDDDITAHAFVFFFAGLETTSTLLCFASLALAMHPEIQKKLQDNIDQVFNDEDQTISYEALHGMAYLDMVVSETLRLYTPAVITDRKCVKAYTIPATEDKPGLQVEEGEMITLPIFGIHRDPDHFPDPHSFQPERFSEENKHNIKPYTYLPFGVGPRMCIGNRFALMEVKTALVYLLSRFDLQVVDKTPLPIRFTNGMQLDGGFWIGLSPRNKQAPALDSSA